MTSPKDDDRAHFPDAKAPEEESLLEDAKSRTQRLEESLQAYANPDRWFGGLTRRKRYADDEVPYVGFNDRMFAVTLDFALLIFLLYPLFMELTAIIYAGENPSAVLQAAANSGNLRAALATDEGRHAINLYLLSNGLQVLIIGALTLGCWLYAGATPGKWLLRMRIVNAADGFPAGKGQLVRRFLGYIISPALGAVVMFITLPMLGITLAMLAGALAFMAGFLWMGFDEEKQGWHDKLASTAVVRIKGWKLRMDPEVSLFPEAFFEEDEEETEAAEDSAAKGDA